MIAGLLFAGSLSAREGANYDEAKVGTFELPDPLHPAGGAPVRSPADWLSSGRPTTLALFEQHVYGKIPEVAAKLEFETLSVRKDALAGLATRQVIRIRLADVPAWAGIEMLVYTPNAASGPVPAFVGLNFGGNHTVSPETDIPLTTKSGSAANPARGLAASRWPLELILKRGYGLVTAYCGDVEPDHPAGWHDGLRGALAGPGKTTSGEGEWGALGAWAWGLSRMLDGLETLPEVDARHCAVIGHSRLGKAALWAGAQDQRFALVVSNNSGEGGAALKYRDFGETPAIITSSFPHWFTATYQRYGPAPRSCPVDQHQLLALVAPRLLYVASATDDRWADPQGEFLAAKSAGAVYALFGKTGVAVDTQPPPAHPVGDSIGYHLRTGKHDITAYDWKQYLDFADRHWRGGGGGVELHVATTGDDAQPGTAAAPLRTIQHAAELARPGDTVTVHAGIYRERINPPRGGDSEARRIVYQAASGERVEIKGSEVVTGWVRDQGEVWRVTLPNAMFGGFNPFSDLIHGDWFNPCGREHHTGAVYLNGDWLTEAATLDNVLKPAGGVPATPLWFARVDEAQTTIWAQFSGVDPNQELVEINVRQTVFYPDQPGRDFITVRGFTLGQAATPWAPPTAEQIGLIGTHWSKGWMIENNTISHSVCSGIALGKHGDEFDNTSADTAEGYVKTIERAHAFTVPWTRDRIGHHLVRNNTISHCEQTGIVGSLGAAFSTITGNTIHDIHVRCLFSGAEMAGIKLHAAIDTTISGNHIYRTCRGLWLDWMAQGTRVSGNLFHDNADQDLFMEVNHGPFVVDNNLFLSAVNLLDVSEGGTYAHNLFAGRFAVHPELNRETPYHPAHSTEVAGLAKTPGGDNRFYNNVFVGPGGGASDPKRTVPGLWVYDSSKVPQLTGGNIYCNGARSLANERNALVLPDYDPALKWTPQGIRLEFSLDMGPHLAAAVTARVTTQSLGQVRVPKLPYQNPDGTSLVIDTDFLGRSRDPARPSPGPFEHRGNDPLQLLLP